MVSNRAHIPGVKGRTCVHIHSLFTVLSPTMFRTPKVQAWGAGWRLLISRFPGMTPNGKLFSCSAWQILPLHTDIWEKKWCNVSLRFNLAFVWFLLIPCPPALSSNVAAFQGPQVTATRRRRLDVTVPQAILCSRCLRVRVINNKDVSANNLQSI